MEKVFYLRAVDKPETKSPLLKDEKKYTTIAGIWLTKEEAKAKADLGERIREEGPRCNQSGLEFLQLCAAYENIGGGAGPLDSYVVPAKDYKVGQILDKLPEGAMNHTDYFFFGRSGTRN